MILERKAAECYIRGAFEIFAEANKQAVMYSKKNKSSCEIFRVEINKKVDFPSLSRIRIITPELRSNRKNKPGG